MFHKKPRWKQVLRRWRSEIRAERHDVALAAGILSRPVRKRALLSGMTSGLTLFAIQGARAGVAYAPAPNLVLPPSVFTVPVDIDYGQSWRTNTFDSFADFGLTELGDGYSYSVNPLQNLVLTPKVASIGSPTFAPGPLPNSAGISLPGSPIGITSYSSSDGVTIGRASVIAQQYRRAQLGLSHLTPILQFCAAYPSSSWTAGPGGGLGPGAVFTGSISNDVLTVTDFINGNLITTGQYLSFPGAPAKYYVLSFGTGTGGTGTYNVAVSQTVLSETITVGSASIVGSIGGAAPNNILTVTQVNSGTISVGAALSGTSIAAGSKIFAQLSGTTGGVGTYQIVVGSQQSFASQQMSSLGVSWANMLTIISALDGLFPANLYPYLSLTDHYYRCVKWTQGGASNNAVGATIADFTAMTQAFDALSLRGTSTAPLNYFVGQRAGISTDTDLSGLYAYMDVYNFCRQNANGRTWGTTPWYQWPFEGPNEPSYGNIHTGPYGTVREGEFEGYAVSVVYDEGIGHFTPLWPSLTSPITISGQTITIPFDRPSGSGFANGMLGWMSTPEDGIKVWPNYGFNVKRNGTFLTVAPAIVGMTVQIAVTEAISPGDVLEVSYAMYGPGGTNPGLCSGVGGNLMMAGPASLMFPGKTINAWCWQFLESITA